MFSYLWLSLYSRRYDGQRRECYSHSPNQRGYESILEGAQRPCGDHSERQGGAKVLRQREALLLSAAERLPDGQRVADQAPAAARQRRQRAVDANSRPDRHRQLGARNAAALARRQVLRRRQDLVHLRLGQAQALLAHAQDVLRRLARNRLVQQQEDQSDLQAVEEEAVDKKLRL